MSVQLRENGEQLLKKKKNVKRKPLLECCSALTVLIRKKHSDVTGK